EFAPAFVELGEAEEGAAPVESLARGLDGRGEGLRVVPLLQRELGQLRQGVGAATVPLVDETVEGIDRGGVSASAALRPGEVHADGAVIRTRVGEICEGLRGLVVALLAGVEFGQEEARVPAFGALGGGPQLLERLAARGLTEGGGL